MDVVVQVAVQAVDVASFITASDASKEVFKTATLLKTLTVNALITGDVSVGKKTLACYIMPNAAIIDASNFNELLTTIESSKEIIITNLENSPNIKTLVDTIALNNVKVIATAKSSYNNEYLDDIFSVKFDVPPLSKRLEDIEFLVDKFAQEASSLFGNESNIDMKNFVPNLKTNANSLRRQVMINSLLKDIKDTELMEIIENYLFDKLGSNSDYRDNLYLYEVPLIKSGLKKFKSQLQLSDKLGLNRNTLRKKIADNKDYL